MASIRACATLVRLATSNTSQSPIQKSNWRYAGDVQGAEVTSSVANARLLTMTMTAEKSAVKRTAALLRSTIDLISPSSQCSGGCHIHTTPDLRSCHLGLTSHISSGEPYPRQWAGLETS